jgi:hypothetical protein
MALIATEAGTVDQIAATATAIAALATVTALIWIARQTKASRDAVLVAHFDATASRMLAIDELVLGRPELRRWLHPVSGQRIALPPDGAGRDEALAMAEYMVDFLDTEMLRQQQVREVAEALPDFEPWLARLLHYSEAQCAFLTEANVLYSDEILARYAVMCEGGLAAWAPADAIWRPWVCADKLSSRWLQAVQSMKPWPAADSQPRAGA